MSLNKISTFVLTWVAIFLILGLSGTVYGQHAMHHSSTPLTEPGNDIFGTIQEVVQKLEADPETDWSQVNLEALRQHLLDMKAFTEEIEVLTKNQIQKGIVIKVRPQSDRAAQALKRLFNMHPNMIKKEKGWDMDVKQDDGNWIITCTTDDETSVEKLRALGYIGLLTEGAHHQLHHWMIATGKINME